MPGAIVDVGGAGVGIGGVGLGIAVAVSGGGATIAVAGTTVPLPVGDTAVGVALTVGTEAGGPDCGLLPAIPVGVATGGSDVAVPGEGEGAAGLLWTSFVDLARAAVIVMATTLAIG